MSPTPLIQQVMSFAQRWFDSLSERRSIEEILPLLDLDSLQMEFPEATLRTETEFRDWYRQVGTLFRDQTHVVESLAATGDPARPEVLVTVVWAGIDAQTDERFAYRVEQTWQLDRDAAGQLRISRYHVGPLRALEPFGVARS